MIAQLLCQLFRRTGEKLSTVLRTISILIALWCAGADSANAQVYYSDYFTSVNAANWTSNGVVTPTASGLTSAATNGGSAISTLAVPDGTNNYEVKTYLYMTASGGNYIQYLRATSDSLLGPVTSGSYYAVELANPTMSGTTGSGTLNVYKRVSGTLTLLNTQVVACMHGMPLHSIMRGTQLQVYVNGYLKVTLTDTALATGKPGVGARAMPSGPTLFLTELRQTDGIAPGAVNPQSISTSVQPNAVDFQWQGAVDNPGGSGLLHYRVLRNGTFFGNFTTAGFTDATVAASANYSYQIITVDIAGNEAAPASVQVTTPPTGSIDPRRVGVRPTGSYWGALGEQIDLMSGNLNYTMPLVSPQGRGGWSVPFA